LVLALVALGAPLVLFAGWTWRTVSRVDLTRPQEASIIYAAGRALAPGLSVDAADLAGTLRRLGYREVQAPPAAPGQFRREEGRWELFLRARDDPRATRPALAVRLGLAGPRVATVATRDGAPIEDLELEPEVLTGLGDLAGQIRRPVPLAAVPPHLVAAVLAVEDHRFYEHRGVDARAVLRAVWVNLRRGETAQGGSTLTQQLVKNLVLTPKRTWSRKVREAALAIALERRYGKATILEAYLNGIYLGQHGAFSLYGVGAAARAFFGKDVERLTLGEAALLAGLIRAPNTYSPLRHPERAHERRALVLRRMKELGLADPARLAQATREPVRIQRGEPPRLLGPHFVDHVRDQIE
jgi:penicillin-binding protein 1B